MPPIQGPTPPGVANVNDVQTALKTPAPYPTVTAPASTSGFTPQIAPGTTAPNVTNPPAATTADTGNTTSVPVVTGSAATADFNAKQAATNAVNNGIAGQATTVASNKAAAPTDNTSQVNSTLSEIQTALADNPNADPHTLGLNDTPPAGSTKIYDSTQPSAGYKYMYDANGDRVQVLDNPSTGDLNKQAKDVQTQQDQLYQSLKDEVTQLQNGTIPLTPAQQAQVNATQAQFDQLITKQKLYNQNYEAGVTNAGIASGRQRYSPDLALGQIQDAVTTGLQKVADLESKASAAVSKLTIAFQNEDYNAVNNTYKEMQTALDGKTKAINDMMTQINNSTKTAITQLNDQIKQDQAQQKIDNATAKAALDFATKHNIQTPYYVVGGAVFSTKDGHWISPDEAKQVGLDTQNQDQVTNVETKGDNYVVKNQKINIGGVTHVVNSTYDANGKLVSQTDAGVAGANPKSPGSPKGGYTPAQVKAAHSEIDKTLASQTGKATGVDIQGNKTTDSSKEDNYVSPTTWNAAVTWANDNYGITQQQFYTAHKGFVNPTHASDYQGVPGKANAAPAVPTKK